MMLVECVALHEPALRASFLAVYRITVEGVDPLDAADLIVWLPPGCALWRSVGGPNSLTQEAHELRFVEWRLRVLAWMQTQDGHDGRNQPEPPAPIPYSGEVEADALRAASRARRQLDARERREASRGG